MEKTEQMYRFEQETSHEALVTVPIEGDSLLVVSEEYARWMETELQIETIRANALQNAFDRCEAKATAYDRLMSGGKKTLKEWANIFGAYFAVGKSGVGYVFRDNPPLVESTFMGQCFAIVYPEFIDFSGDWTTSLTLPDGWEEK